MKQFSLTLALLGFSTGFVHGQAPQALILQQTIALPGVTGKFDHFALDRTGNRLFAAASGPQAVEVIDLVGGKIVETLGGIGKPHGVMWLPESGRLFVADGAKGELDVFAGAPLKRIATIPLSEDADDMVYDDATKLLYVGHGGTDAANPPRVAVIDAAGLKVLAQLAVAAHPEALELDATHDRILVNVADVGKIAVIDGKSHKIAATWTLTGSKGNTPLAYDAARNLVLVGCRTPARIVALDGKDGREIAKANADSGADDLFFDPASRVAYMIAGSGAVDTFSVAMAGEIAALSATHTAAGAKTGLLDSTGGLLYVGIPGTGGTASIAIYKTR